MLRRFGHEDVQTQNQMKSSAQRALKQGVLSNFPKLGPYMSDILPKKKPVILVKCRDKVNLVLVQGDPHPVFFSFADGPFFPTLRMLHRYPFAMRQFQADRGAIRHVLSGSAVMCQGLTSPGGRLDPDTPANTPVALMAEGKQHAMAIGLTTLSDKQIRETNKGPCVENVHTVGDGLWKLAF